MAQHFLNFLGEEPLGSPVRHYIKPIHKDNPGAAFEEGEGEYVNNFPQAQSG